MENVKNTGKVREFPKKKTGILIVSTTCTDILPPILIVNNLWLVYFSLKVWVSWWKFR